MEAVKVFERKDVPLDWDYDDDADTLYLSFGKPKVAVGLDIREESPFDTTSKPRSRKADDCRRRTPVGRICEK